MVISEPSAPSAWLLGLAHVRQRSYSIHAVILEYAKIEQVKERLLAGWLSNKLRYKFHDIISLYSQFSMIGNVLGLTQSARHKERK